MPQRGSKEIARPTASEALPLGSEHAEQKALFRWIDTEGVQIHSCLALAFAIPNGGKRGKAAAGKLKAEGVRAGVPDLFLPVPRGEYHGLFIEMKTTGGSLSQAQRAWNRALIRQGYLVAVCRGWLRARDCLLTYLEA